MIRTYASLAVFPSAAAYIGTMAKALDTDSIYVSRVVNGVAEWLITTDPLCGGPLGGP